MCRTVLGKCSNHCLFRGPDRVTSGKNSGSPKKYAVFKMAEMVKTSLRFYLFLVQSLVKTQPGWLSQSCFSACFPDRAVKLFVFTWGVTSVLCQHLFPNGTPQTAEAHVWTHKTDRHHCYAGKSFYSWLRLAGWLVGWLGLVQWVVISLSVCLTFKPVIIPTALPCLNTLCCVLGE